MPVWESEGLLEDENSMLCCSGEAGIAGRHGWCALEMPVELFLLPRFLFEKNALKLQTSSKVS